jgi:hypothetical protein
MNLRFTVVETALNRVEFRWKWLRFLRHSFNLGSALCFLMLMLGGAILTGLLINKYLAFGLFGLLAVAGFIGWCVIIVAAAVGSPERKWLGSSIERTERRLLDRLNTLLFLENQPAEVANRGFAERIASQAQGVLKEPAPRAVFSGKLVLTSFAGFIILLGLTLTLYLAYSPLELLAYSSRVAAAHEPPKPLELALPDTNNVEAHQAWGEVRITDPGGDLKVTKVDVVPLQIEAAANEPLAQVAWASTVNGTDEATHELPRPAEPRYGVYQPSIYLDELNLSDWDVLTYYARASTEKQNSYASEVYFVEVRPFREDIMKMPGGENGKANRSLNEISGLISRQQHVIRQTHQHLQKPQQQENLQAQDRKKIAAAEGDLGESARHLYAKMATEMENKPIGEALDNLAKAEKDLSGASKSLSDNTMNEAQNQERSALADLIAARKMFQKAVSDNPKDFDEQPPADDEASPIAHQKDQLKEMAEFRDEAKAAQDFVEKSLQQQKQIEQRARSARQHQMTELGAQEHELQNSLKQFQDKHPQVFNKVQQQANQTDQQLAQAAEALDRRNPQAADTTQEATRQLQDLSQGMRAQSAQKQLADAYKLKKMIDKEAQTFSERSKSDSNISDEKLQQTVDEARDAVNQLKRTAEEEPTRDAFGPALRDALSGENKVNLDAKLNRLQRPRKVEDALDNTSKEQRAGEASQALANVSKAFEKSQPDALQMARNDQNKPGEQDNFNQGMAELDSLIKQLDKERQLPRETQRKQGRQALYNLQTGMRAFHGSNEDGNQILLQLETMLKGEAPLEVGDLKKLMDALQRFSVETSEKLGKKDLPELANIDPSKLPPAYRGRIQKYFQKLSENKR